MSDLTFIERSFDKAIISVLREPTVGYKLMPLNTDFKGLGKESIEHFNYTARGAAKTAYGFDRSGYDTVDASGTILKVPVLQTSVKIPRRTFEAIVNNGVPLSNDLALDMVRAINKQVDALVINGYTLDGTNYDIKGMTQVAGTSVTGATVQTFGNSYKAIQSAITNLILAGVEAPAYNAVMNPTQAAYLKGSLNANSGNPEMDMVREALNPNGGNVGQFFQRSDVPTGYMIVTPAAVETSKAFFDLIETVPPTNHAWYDQGNAETGDVWVEQYTCLTPRFKHITSSGTGTDAAVAYVSTMT